MPSEWTREHDRLIAEVAEGLEVRQSKVDQNTLVTDNPPGYVSFYDHEPASILRAYEAWRAKDPENRSMRVANSEDCEHCVTLVDYLTGERYTYTDPIFIDALRWALYAACGGKA